MRRLQRILAHRSIPACVGEPTAQDADADGHEFYPRLCLDATVEFAFLTGYDGLGCVGVRRRAEATGYSGGALGLLPGLFRRIP